MAYDRFETQRPRDEHRSRDDHRPDGDRSRGGRGFFERAGDEVASWFGDEEAERRREQDDRTGGAAYGRGGSDRYAGGRDGRDAERGGYSGGLRGREEHRGSYGAQDYQRQPEWDRNERSQYDRTQDHPRDDYRPFAGDYGRAGSDAGSDHGRAGPGARYREERQRGGGIGSAIGAAAGAAFGSRDQNNERGHDPHYAAWRQKQIDQLDSDYDDYRREHQSKFDNDFSGWRGQRQSKRQLLSGVREHMEVVGADEKTVGKVDKVQDDKIILTKDSDGANGVHRSFNCSAIDRVEGDRLVLSHNAEEAKRSLVEERGFVERSNGDQRQRQDHADGPHMLERSFSGTYR